MAVTATVSNQGKYAFAMKLINLDTDTLRIILMKSGFVFDKDIHGSYWNLYGDISGGVFAITSSLELFSSSGGFDGLLLLPGHAITMSGFATPGNNCTKIIDTVTDDTITFTSTAGLVEEAEGESVSVIHNEGLETGFGYTHDSKTLASTTVTKDNTNDRAEMTCSNIVWTASGGSIGPTPGAIIYSSNATNKPVLGYLDFDGNKTATDGMTLTLSNVKVRIT